MCKDLLSHTHMTHTHTRHTYKWNKKIHTNLNLHVPSIFKQQKDNVDNEGYFLLRKKSIKIILTPEFIKFRTTKLVANKKKRFTSQR